MMVSAHRRFSSDSQDFEFNKYSNGLELPYAAEEAVASADELFYKGQLLPLHRVICLSPPSPSSASLCAIEQNHPQKQQQQQQQQTSQTASGNSARYKLSIRDQQFSSCRMDDIQFLDIFDELRSSSFRLQSPGSPRIKAPLCNHSHSHIRHASLSSICYNYNPASSTSSVTSNWEQYQYQSSSISTSCTSQDQSSCSSRDSNSSSQDYPAECNTNTKEDASAAKHSSSNNSRRSRRPSFALLQSWKLLLNSALLNKKKSINHTTSATATETRSVQSLMRKIKPLMKIKSTNDDKKKGVGWFSGFTRESSSASTPVPGQLQRRFSQSSVSHERRPKLSVQLVRPRFRSVSTSCPASALASPNHSGLLSPHRVNAPISSFSSMQELHSAIQGAIAHCKQSFSSNNPPPLGPS